MNNQKPNTIIEERVKELNNYISCPDCEGEGIIANEQWLNFYKHHDGSSDFEEKKLLDFFNVYSTDELPEEEYTCPDCAGEGQRKRTDKEKEKFLEQSMQLAVEGERERVIKKIHTQKVIDPAITCLECEVNPIELEHEIRLEIINSLKSNE